MASIAPSAPESESNPQIICPVLSKTTPVLEDYQYWLAMLEEGGGKPARRAQKGGSGEDG
jgi:hypothetical protein